MRAVRLWNLEEASKAVPYLRSVVGSLREHWLAAQSKRRDADRLAQRPGRPNRTGILARADAADEQERAENRFNEALEELLGIDAYLLDPIRGIVLIPFRKEDDLAWYVYDLFDEQGLSGWRYHDDPMEECRPLAGKDTPPAPSLPNESVS